MEIESQQQIEDRAWSRILLVYWTLVAGIVIGVAGIIMVLVM